MIVLGKLIAWFVLVLQPGEGRRIEGKLRHDPKLEGGTWTLTCRGKVYDLHGVPPGFRHGDSVTVRGRVLRNAFCIHMVGPIFRIESIQKTGPSVRSGAIETIRGRVRFIETRPGTWTVRMGRWCYHLRGIPKEWKVRADDEVVVTGRIVSATVRAKGGCAGLDVVTIRRK